MICISAKNRFWLSNNQLLCVKSIFGTILVLSCIIAGQCQDVEIRASNSGDKVDNSIRSTSRNVYSPRSAYGPHHQIMHFGKRPQIPLPSQVSDLYWKLQQQQQQQMRYPYAQNSNMEPLEEDITAYEFPEPIQQNRMPIYSIITPGSGSGSGSSSFESSFPLYSNNPIVNRFLQTKGNQAKFSRLMSDADNQQSTGESDSNVQGSTDQQQSTGNINVATRSPHSVNRLSSQPFGSKNYISTLLLGRASTPALGSNFGSFIKKAEPKDNVFMHFG